MSNNNWADLPNEILSLVGKHLDSRIDVFRFRAVCPSWRSAISLSSRSNQSSFPPPPTPPSHPLIGATPLLSPVTICRLEHHTQDAACLVKVVESTSGELQLLSPLTSDQRPNICKTLNMLDFRLIELARGYHVPSNSTLKKVVLFYDCGFLALFKVGKLQSWKFGDDEWTNLGDDATHYDDVVVSNNQYYVIDSVGTIFWVDKCSNVVQYSPPLYGFGQLKNLVASDGHLYVVDSYLENVRQGLGFEWDYHYRPRLDIKVYELDEEWGTWVHVKSLGDRVFVLGNEACFSVSVAEFPGCQGNCIYFVDSSNRMLEYQTASASLKRMVSRVFRFENGCIKMVECFPTYKRLFSPCLNWPITRSGQLLKFKEL